MSTPKKNSTSKWLEEIHQQESAHMWKDTCVRVFLFFLEHNKFASCSCAVKKLISYFKISIYFMRLNAYPFHKDLHSNAFVFVGVSFVRFCFFIIIFHMWRFFQLPSAWIIQHVYIFNFIHTYAYIQIYFLTACVVIVGGGKFRYDENASQKECGACMTSVAVIIIIIFSWSW